MLLAANDPRRAAIYLRISQDREMDGLGLLHGQVTVGFRPRV